MDLIEIGVIVINLMILSLNLKLYTEIFKERAIQRRGSK